jgi:hypothetical protein
MEELDLTSVGGLAEKKEIEKDLKEDEVFCPSSATKEKSLSRRCNEDDKV